MIDPTTIIQAIGVVLMIAPSSSDHHVKNYSEPLLLFKTMEACKPSAASLNAQRIETLPPIEEQSDEVLIVYAWCKPIFGEAT